MVNEPKDKLPARTAMWTELSIHCKDCDGAIPVRVNAFDDASMRDGADQLANLMSVHMRRDHA